MEFKFKKDELGYSATCSDKEFNDFALWLTDDIQSSVKTANMVLEKIEEIENGKLDSWDCDGNAFMMEIDQDGSKVYYLEGDTNPSSSELKKLTLVSLKKVLLGWVSFISERNPSSIVVDH